MVVGPPTRTIDISHLQVVTLISTRTHNCPSDLVERIKEAHAKGEMVFDVSVASNGDWFLSTSAFNSESILHVIGKKSQLNICHLSAAKTFEDVSKSRVTKFCQLATNGGVKTHVGNIRWITFMPDAEGYIGVTVVDGVESCFYEGIPQSLEMHLSSSKSKTLRSVSVGHDNSWIVVYGDGSSNWNGILPDALAKKLKAGYSSTVEVRASPGL